MNSSPIRRRFSSGLGDAVEAGEEALGGVDVDERHVEMLAERLHDLCRLVLAQEAVVDEDAGQLVADRAGGRAAPRPPSRRRPRARRAPRCEPTCARIRSTCSSMTAVAVPRGIEPRPRGAGSSRASAWPLGVWTTSGWNWTPYSPRSPASNAATGVDGDPAVTARALGRRRHRVAMAHPADLLLGEPREQLAAVDAERRLPELRHVRPLDGASELLRHQLRAVADAERRHAEREQTRCRRAARPRRKRRQVRR